MLEFDAEMDTLRCTASYRHPPEVWHIASCPEDPRRLITVFNDGAPPPCSIAPALLEAVELHARLHPAVDPGIPPIHQKLAKPRSRPVRCGMAMRAAGLRAAGGHSAGSKARPIHPCGYTF